MGGASTQITFEVPKSVSTKNNCQEKQLVWPLWFERGTIIALFRRTRSSLLMPWSKFSSWWYYICIFVQEKLPAHLTTEVNLGCDSHMTIHNYKLYVATFLGYGASTARSRYLDTILTKRNNSVHRWALSLSSSSVPTLLRKISIIKIVCH